MSFALSSLITKTRRLIGEEDTTNTHFDDDELTDYLNQGNIFLASEMEWPEQTSTATSVEGQALYTLPDDFITIADMFFDNIPLKVLERADLKEIRSDWQNADNGIPVYAYKADNGVVGLWPPPDADNASLDIQIQYISLPAELSADTDVPDIHSAFQLCLPFYAAFLADYKLGNQKASQLHFAMYETHRKSLMSKVQGFAEGLKRFRWPRSYG